MRYIGNKEKILKEIEEVINTNQLYKNCKSFFDAFSGTATVGEFFKDKFKIIANDNLYMSYVISQAKLNSPDGKYEGVENLPQPEEVRTEHGRIALQCG